MAAPSLSRQLLRVARRAAVRGASPRANQAELRRAVSTAYYALFHLVCEQTSMLLAGPGPKRQELRHNVQRSLDHSTLKQVCKAFCDKPSKAGPVQPLWMRLGVGTNADIETLCNNFVSLQEFRHQADYDQSRFYTHSDAQSAVDQAQAAFEAWARLRSAHDELTRLFALTILYGQKLGRR